MSRLRLPPSGVVLAALVILALGGAGPAVVADENDNGSTTVTDTESAVGIAVDCDESRVELTAPDEYRYDVTVGVANVTATASQVSRSSYGSVEGNVTVELDERGIVFTAVQNESDGETVATDVTDCSTPDEATTTTRMDDAEPRVDIDCENETVRFVASAETEYVAKVTVISLSPTASSTSSATRTLEGNATVSIDGGELVAAFASTGELGDDRTASAIRDCSSVRSGENETTSV